QHGAAAGPDQPRRCGDVSGRLRQPQRRRAGQALLRPGRQALPAAADIEPRKPSRRLDRAEPGAIGRHTDVAITLDFAAPALHPPPPVLTSPSHALRWIMGRTRLTLRVDFGPHRAIGPGKIRLLEAIDKGGSISEAGRALGMSYRRAWLLIDDVNRCFREPVVSTQPGGKSGGGASLTSFGRKLGASHRPLQRDATPPAQAPP